MHSQRSHVDKTEIVRSMHSEIVTFIKEKKYKQAVSKLYDCERFIFVHKITTPSLKMYIGRDSFTRYTNYLVVLTYYKASKFDKCVTVIQKSLISCEELDTLAEEYVLHIRYIWARVLFSKGEYLTAIKIFTQILAEFDKIFGMGWSNTVFSHEHILRTRNSIGECYMVDRVELQVGCRFIQGCGENIPRSRVNDRRYNQIDYVGLDHII